MNNNNNNLCIVLTFHKKIIMINTYLPKFNILQFTNIDATIFMRSIIHTNNNERGDVYLYF